MEVEYIHHYSNSTVICRFELGIVNYTKKIIR